MSLCFIVTWDSVSRNGRRQGFMPGLYGSLSVYSRPLPSKNSLLAAQLKIAFGRFLFILNVDWVLVRNWVLRYKNENAKRSAESILMPYIPFLCLFLIHLVQVKQIVKCNKYKLTKRWLQAKL